MQINVLKVVIKKKAWLKELAANVASSDTIDASIICEEMEHSRVLSGINKNT